jgi:hypothetical protein
MNTEILKELEAAYSRSDVLSLVLGRYAWPIISSPHNRMK